MGRQHNFVKRIPTVIGICICIVLVPVLVMNLTIIIKSYIYPDEVPDFFGIKPFIVLTGSMEGTISAGDLVVTREIAPETLETGDIISYKIEQSVITHRIVEMTEADGEPAFVMKGDANNIEDEGAVLYSQVEGIYLFRIAGLGNLAMFMQTPVGMLVFIGIPLCAFVLVDVVRRNRYAKRAGNKDREMEKELERLRSRLDEQSKDK